jgi:hypothetical protein
VSSLWKLGILLESPAREVLLLNPPWPASEETFRSKNKCPIKILANVWPSAGEISLTHARLVAQVFGLISLHLKFDLSLMIQITVMRFEQILLQNRYENLKLHFDIFEN